MPPKQPRVPSKRGGRKAKILFKTETTKGLRDRPKGGAILIEKAAAVAKGDQIQKPVTAALTDEFMRTHLARVRSATAEIGAKPADGFECARILATYLRNLLKSAPLRDLLPSPPPGLQGAAHPLRQFEIDHINALAAWADNPAAPWPPTGSNAQ